ncbi:MAG TPA: hypothetical protein PKA59_11265 [Chakrabartia sp.]|jgi:hypothetical protein|nr:hypothetical protein [Chakrabartia sp.]
MVSLSRLAAVTALALALSACGGKDDAEEIDNRIAAKSDADPALTASLEDQIMVDTTLSGQANGDAVRPAKEPAQSPIPTDEPSRDLKTAPATTLGSLAAKQGEMSRDAFNGCGLSVNYSAGFAAKVPADLPAYGGSKVIEAAGSDENGCALRAVTYAAPIGADALVKHYADVAAKAGYSVAVKDEGKGKMISGKRAADGGAFYVIIEGQGTASTADLVVNNGR